MSATVLQPGDAGYDDARKVWNGRFDPHPARIVLASEPAHVVSAIADARAGGLEIGVKSGGHDYAGNSGGDGGLLIDLSRMNEVSIDAARRRATVGAGARWRDFDAAAQASGLATTGATVSTVGVAGFTLGGGEGWLTRKHGLACDNLVSAEVVTAAGEIVRASEDENADLFWALRGGGGNFGVVTEFEFALHPLDHPVLAGQVIYPFERAAELLRFYRDRFATAPDEAACFSFVYRVPPLDVFPQERHGELVLAFVLAWMGAVAEGEAWMAPFRSLGNPVLDGIAPVPYLALQQSFDAGMGSGSRWYTRAHSFDALPDAAIDAFTGAIGSLPGEFTTAYLGPGGGAAGRRAVDATAYPHRRSVQSLHAFSGWVDPARDDEIMAWTRAVSAAVEPYANPGVYVNLLGEDEGSRVAGAYGPNYARLVRVKSEWDPDNLFHGNHNIAPAQ